MDPEDLCIVVTLCEGKAVTLRRAVMASHTEQNLIDGVVGNLCVVVGIQQPGEIKMKLVVGTSLLLNSLAFTVFFRVNVAFFFSFAYLGQG